MISMNPWREHLSFTLSVLQGKLPNAEGIPLLIDESSNHQFGCWPSHADKP